MSRVKKAVLNGQGKQGGEVAVHCAFDKLVPLAELIAHPKNPNRHGKQQVAILAKIIKHQGWRAPIVVSRRSGLIVAGHGRLEAARALGLAGAPVNHQDFASEADEIAHLVADNQIAELAEMAQDDLKALLAEMGELNFDMELMGFDEDTLAALLNGAENDVDAEPRFDQAGALRKKWAVEPGDLWALGEHRLLCGDATKDEDVRRLHAGARPHLMVTDPPYGVNYDPAWRERVVPGSDYALGAVTNDDRVDWTQAWRLFSGDVVYCWHAGLHASEVQRSLEAAGFDIRCQIIWAKNCIVMGRGNYHWQHEPCWYAVRVKGGKGHWYGDRKQTSVWQIDKQIKSETGHSTQKPTECMERPIRNNSRKGDWVYDPFVGSGTTIIAAERTARRCLAIEILPEHVAVTVERYWEATGKTPTRI